MLSAIVFHNTFLLHFFNRGLRGETLNKLLYFDGDFAKMSDNVPCLLTFRHNCVVVLLNGILPFRFSLFQLIILLFLLCYGTVFIFCVLQYFKLLFIGSLANVLNVKYLLIVTFKLRLYTMLFKYHNFISSKTVNTVL